MQVFPYHVFVCVQRKADGVPCCAARGSAAVIETMRREVAARGLAGKVMVTTCGSIGLCERGPNMVVYPDGVWYSGVRPEDVCEIVTSHFEQGVPVARLVNTGADALRGEIAGNRERFLQSVRARDASGMPPDDLQQTIRSFQESRVILTAIELDAFSAVGDAATAAEVAARIQADTRATARLLDALASLGLIAKTGERYSCTPVAARYLASTGANDSRAGLLHIANLWHTWSTLTEAVRAGTAVGQREQPERGEAWTEAFIAAMHQRAAAGTGPLVNAVGAGRVRRMLDVGGGSGAFSIAFARANPELQADIVDLATVTPIAQRHIAAAGVADRVRTRVGDLRTCDLGTGYDLVLVSAICHMLDPAGNRDLLRRCHAATAPGGRIVIQEFIPDPTRTGPRYAVLFALNMLVGTTAGDTYTQAEYTAWLAEAGYRNVVLVALPGPSDLIVADA